MARKAAAAQAAPAQTDRTMTADELCDRLERLFLKFPEARNARIMLADTTDEAEANRHYIDRIEYDEHLTVNGAVTFFPEFHPVSDDDMTGPNPYAADDQDDEDDVDPDDEFDEDDDEDDDDDDGDAEALVRLRSLSRGKVVPEPDDEDDEPLDKIAVARAVVKSRRHRARLQMPRIPEPTPVQVKLPKDVLNAKPVTPVRAAAQPVTIKTSGDPIPLPAPAPEPTAPVPARTVFAADSKLYGALVTRKGVQKVLSASRAK